MAQDSAKIENNRAKIGKYLQYFAAEIFLLREVPFV
jgi:hypothetical protein